MTLAGNWDIKEVAVLDYTNRYRMPLAHPSPTTRLLFPQHNYSLPTLESLTNYNLYYSLTYDHVYIIMLSSFEPYGKNSHQYSWLEEQLVHANSIRSIYPWIIVCGHTPMYTSSSRHIDLPYTETLDPLLKKYNVDLYFGAHDHAYERTYPMMNFMASNYEQTNYLSGGDTIHLLVGTGGAHTHDWLDAPPWSVHRESSYGYTKITINPYQIHVTFQRLNGTIGDYFTITKSSRIPPHPTVSPRPQQSI
eukprot:gene11177-13021_t